MKIKLLHILLLFSTFVFSQQKLEKADKLFDEMAYVEAVQAYEAYLKNTNKPDGKVMLKIAESYYKIGNTAKALNWYEKWADTNPAGPVTTADWHYAQALRIERGNDIGIFVYYKFDDNTTERLINQKNYLDSITKLPPAFNVTNLSSNSRLSDFGTAFYGGKIVYASAKDTMGTGGKYYKYNNQPYLKLFVAERNHEDGSLFGEREFYPDSQITYHNATPAFLNSETLFFSTNTTKKSGRLNNGANGTNNLQLMRGTIKGSALKVEPMPFNSKNYSVAQPAVTADGKWLYFVSDMPGGYGETDIYRVEIMADGSYGQSQNLGPIVNTPHKEMFPFVQNDVLYFASEGHYGLGGLDIFKSTIAGNTYSEPQNMGIPVNSNRDDFALILSEAGDFGYFSSNRDGGKGDDDIYYFSKIKECVQVLLGTVVHKNARKPVKGAVVKVITKDGKIQDLTETDADGFYSFKLPCNTALIIEVSDENHALTKTEIVTGSDPEMKLDFELLHYDDLIVKDNDVEKIAINPIYFDLDKYVITKQAVSELDKVVHAMQSFPDMIIKIESHTDSRASDDYNLTLSQNRAKATYDYIISKGVNPKRIESVTGYGETRLLNGCSNNVPCSEEEHQLNRRSDFIVVKK